MRKTNQPATAADVARRVGVSKWTVIRAFKPDGRIARKTRDRVLEAAGQLGYQPNLLARSLATNKTFQVAILVDDFDNPYKMPTLRRLTASLQREGVLAFLVNINDDFTHQKAIVNARQRRIDSLIFFGTAFDPAIIRDEMTKGSEIPIFVLARESTIGSLPSIFTDPDSAIQEICEFLYPRGYRSPIFVAGPKTISTALGRRRQYRKFWKSKGLESLPEIEVGVYDYGNAVVAIRKYFSEIPVHLRPDVLLCENDILAMAAMDVVRSDLSLVVPDSVAVVGFDGIDLATSKSYDLTTYRQPFEQMVDKLVDMVVGHTPPKKVAMRGELIIGSSA